MSRKKILTMVLILLVLPVPVCSVIIAVQVGSYVYENREDISRNIKVMRNHGLPVEYKEGRDYTVEFGKVVPKSETLKYYLETLPDTEYFETSIMYEYMKMMARREADYTLEENLDYEMSGEFYDALPEEMVDVVFNGDNYYGQVFEEYYGNKKIKKCKDSGRGDGTYYDNKGKLCQVYKVNDMFCIKKVEEE